MPGVLLPSSQPTVTPTMTWLPILAHYHLGNLPLYHSLPQLPKKKPQTQNTNTVHSYINTDEPSCLVPSLFISLSEQWLPLGATSQPDTQRPPPPRQVFWERDCPRPLSDSSCRWCHLLSQAARAEDEDSVGAHHQRGPRKPGSDWVSPCLPSGAGRRPCGVCSKSLQ